MAEITLDVTGFYFSKKITVEDPSKLTVKDVMIKVVSETAGSDAEFTFKSLFTAKGEFCTKIQINHKKPPVSRQFILDNAGNESRFPPTLKEGLYGYDDEAILPANPQLAWQYYIVGNEGKGVIRSAEVNLKRTVVPFSKSNLNPENTGVVLEDKDLITWRLVAICNGPTQSNSGSNSNILESNAKSFNIQSTPANISTTPLKYQNLYNSK